MSRAPEANRSHYNKTQVTSPKENIKYLTEMEMRDFLPFKHLCTSLMPVYHGEVVWCCWLALLLQV